MPAGGRSGVSAFQAGAKLREFAIKLGRESSGSPRAPLRAFRRRGSPPDSVMRGALPDHRPARRHPEVADAKRERARVLGRNPRLAVAIEVEPGLTRGQREALPERNGDRADLERGVRLRTRDAYRRGQRGGGWPDAHDDRHDRDRRRVPLGARAVRLHVAPRACAPPGRGPGRARRPRRARSLESTGLCHRPGGAREGGGAAAFGRGSTRSPPATYAEPRRLHPCPS